MTVQVRPSLSPSGNRVLALAVFAVLAMRVLVPTGWMPMLDNGSIRIAICSGTGPVEILVPMRANAKGAGHGGLGHGGSVHGGTDHSGGQVQGHDPCPFATALGSPFDLPVPVLAVPYLFRASEVAGQLIAARLVAWRAVRPPARGPPSSF